jgi:hypothetical protein
MTKNRIISRSKFVSLLIIGLITFSAILFAENQKAGSELILVDVYRTDLDGRLQYKETIQQHQTDYRTQPIQMPDWPQSMYVPSYFAPSGISLADIDEDGFLEIISGCTDGSVHVWDYQGNVLPGWPKTGLNVIQSKAAVGDIDPDYPGLEILVAGKLNRLYAWHNDGTAVTGWPLTIGETSGFKSPVLFDIDGDGFLEIILGQKIYPEGHVIVFNRDGTIYPGWPQPLDYMCVATPTVGDVDNDGEIEICAVSYYSVFLWDKDGVAKPGWPKLNVAGGMSYAQPIFADLDDDGDMEILHSYNTSNTNYVGIYYHDGSVFENWPQIYPGPQTYVMPITGDIYADDDLEIFGGCHGYGILERHHNGDIVTGWPVDIYNLECSPIIFDLDNDGSREIIFGDNAGSFHAYNGDGSIVEDWPIPAGGNAMVNSAAVGDVDGDGDIEIALVVSNGTVNLWTIEDVPYRSYLTDWGTFYHDIWNTGWMHPSKPQNLVAEYDIDHVYLSWNANFEPDLAGYNIYRSEISGGPYTKLNYTTVLDTTYCDYAGSTEDYYCVTAVIKADAESRLSNEAFAQVNADNALKPINQTLYNYPNPFNPVTTISFSVAQNAASGSDGSSFVTLEIYNIKGQKIKMFHPLPNRGLGTRSTHSVVWNGTDENNKPVSSGIYFYRLINDVNKSDVKKMLLLK